MDRLTVPLQWHFVLEDIEDLPANFRPGATLPEQTPMPAVHDLVRFKSLPEVPFIVTLREFVYGAPPDPPVAVHIHLSRIMKSAG